MKCPIEPGERVFIVHYEGSDVLEAVAGGPAYEGNILVILDNDGDLKVDEDGNSPYVKTVPEAQVFSAKDWLERR